MTTTVNPTTTLSPQCYFLEGNREASFFSTSKFSAKNKDRLSVRAKLFNKCFLKATISNTLLDSARFHVDNNFVINRGFGVALRSKVSSGSNIKALASIAVLHGGHFKSNAHISVPYTDKLSGDLDAIKKYDDFQPSQKLYPLSDVSNELNGNYFVSKSGEQTNLFESINEGVHVGTFYNSFKNSIRIANDRQDFIQPSSLYTGGTFRYVCNIDELNTTPVDSFFIFRASAPIKNYSSPTPPTYKMTNIHVKNSSGQTVIQYNDQDIIGDADFHKRSSVNFTTYVSKQVINNTTTKTSDPNHVSIDGFSSPYQLSFDLEIVCTKQSFDEGFNEGYEDEACNFETGTATKNDYLSFDGSPFSTQSSLHQLNPSPQIRISAIEIAHIPRPASIAYDRDSLVGDLLDGQSKNFLSLRVSPPDIFFLSQESLPMYVEAQKKGVRSIRHILPNQLKLDTYSTDIYPTGYQNSWVSEDESIDNTTESGANGLVDILRAYDTDHYITLNYAEMKPSGKLILRFAHEPPEPRNQLTKGAFSIGHRNLNKEFDYATMQEVRETDCFFDIDDIYLKVIAKKDPLSVDYTIDVVGYSDDKLLFVTPSIGGFLQNIEGIGNIPQITGRLPTDELAFSAETMSDKGELFVRPASESIGGDHYLVAEYADIDGIEKINSTSFREYLIPLKIYDDHSQKLTGRGLNLSMSSLFENLYLDICPLPSGASIAYIALVAYHSPSNAIALRTLGHGDRKFGSANAKIFPSDRQDHDMAFNHGPSYAPLSQIDNIPQGYGFDNTLKTNYSRRWRNVDGLISIGPFDNNQFSYGFLSPVLKKPFYGGYFSFNNDIGNDIISDDMSPLNVIQGSYVGNYDKIRNVGLRFNSTSLFNDPTDYTTTDWTSIAGYESDALYGKIADSFDNAIRVSGELGYISFPSFGTQNGFTVFLRFTPDVTMSGINHNYYNSGTLFSKYDFNNDLEFALGYRDGLLTAYATDDQSQLITIQDTKPYHEYTYPLSVVLKYDGKLGLYTDNEYDSFDFERLRAETDTFSITSSNSELTFGYSHGSGVGFNGFITDIGISSPDTQTDAPSFSFNPNSFLDSLHNKYWDSSESYVSEDDSSRDTNASWSYIRTDLDQWDLGSFNSCEFSTDFSKLTLRIGKNLITHSVKSDGVAYSVNSNITLPPNVDSNVSYHSQIENDMIRFNLSPEPDTFASPEALHSIRPRIVNSFVRGYEIFKDAFKVDTAIEYTTYNDIVWDDGNIGPKLIVSLYTPNKDNPETPYENAGLINRSIHYLRPSGCIHKITSLFDFTDLFNENNGLDSWSDFDQSLRTSEFKQKYLLNDVQSSFLQYDIVYPSGQPYSATLDILGATVTMTESLHGPRVIDNL
jgi:hypothetical protein